MFNIKNPLNPLKPKLLHWLFTFRNVPCTGCVIIPYIIILQILSECFRPCRSGRQCCTTIYFTERYILTVSTNVNRHTYTAKRLSCSSVWWRPMVYEKDKRYEIVHGARNVQIYGLSSFCVILKIRQFLCERRNYMWISNQRSPETRKSFFREHVWEGR